MQGSKGDTDVKDRLLGSVGEGEGGMIWENSTETHILPYEKQITSVSLMYEAGQPKLELWDNPKGENGESGRGVQDGGIHVYLYVWQKPSRYYKIIILQLK